MTCSTCGREERAEAHFCSNCGRGMSWHGTQSFGGRLVRPHEGRMVAGVCAGIALRYGWDVALVRIVALLSILCTGVPVVAYLVAWICIPNAPYLLPADVPAAQYPAGTMGQ